MMASEASFMINNAVCSELIHRINSLGASFALELGSQESHGDRMGCGRFRLDLPLKKSLTLFQSEDEKEKMTDE